MNKYKEDLMDVTGLILVFVVMLISASVMISNVLITSREMKDVNASDLEALTNIVYCETGAKNEDLMLAVAETIINRAESMNISVTELCYMKAQYQYDRRLIESNPVGVDTARRVVRKALAGKKYFDNRYVMYFRSGNHFPDGGNTDHWDTLKATRCRKIDGVSFYIPDQYLAK